MTDLTDINYVGSSIACRRLNLAKTSSLSAAPVWVLARQVFAAYCRTASLQWGFYLCFLVPLQLVRFCGFLHCYREVPASRQECKNAPPGGGADLCQCKKMQKSAGRVRIVRTIRKKVRKERQQRKKKERQLPELIFIPPYFCMKCPNML